MPNALGNGRAGKASPSVAKPGGDAEAREDFSQLLSGAGARREEAF